MCILYFVKLLQVQATKPQQDITKEMVCKLGEYKINES